MADEAQETQGQAGAGEQAGGDSQPQAGEGRQGDPGAKEGSRGGTQAPAASPGQAAQAGSGQTQTPGASAEGRSGAGEPKGRPVPTQAAAGKQPEGGYRLSLTEAQRARLLEEGVLEVSEEQYTSGVRQQMEVLRRRASSAEKRLAEIAAEQEAAERKALEEQSRYKELYEKERQGREAEAAARREDLIRSRFLLAAQARGVVDPEVAFVIARGMPEFAGVGLDEEGAVTGLEPVLESLLAGKPYLVSQPQAKPQTVGAASNPAPQTPPSPKNLAEAGDRLEQALRTGVT